MPVPTLVHLTRRFRPAAPISSQTARPPLSWRSQTDVAAWTQDSAELELHPGTDPDRGRRATASVLVDWPFAPLAPRDDVSLRVRVSGSRRHGSDWSEPLRIRAGFLARGSGRPPRSGCAEPSRRRSPDWPGPSSRSTVRSPPRCSTRPPSAVYQASVNGADVDDQVLKPGWTPYQWRLIHETTDVTTLLPPGPTRSGCGSPAAGPPSGSASGPARAVLRRPAGGGGPAA